MKTKKNENVGVRSIHLKKMRIQRHNYSQCFAKFTYKQFTMYFFVLRTLYNKIKIIRSGE
jgi:hypothetical protein